MRHIYEHTVDNEHQEIKFVLIHTFITFKVDIEYPIIWKLVFEVYHKRKNCYEMA